MSSEGAQFEGDVPHVFVTFGASVRSPIFLFFTGHFLLWPVNFPGVLDSSSPASCLFPSEQGSSSKEQLPTSHLYPLYLPSPLARILGVPGSSAIFITGVVPTLCTHIREEGGGGVIPDGTKPSEGESYKGDLARKKIYPTLWWLFRDKLLPKQITFYGYARTKMSVTELMEKCSLYMKV
uniref:Glucose-6-phosphate 1-dehydrogenase n=1 Tax=Timema tahoe TaxID=61484 RepID=A0A7R9ITP2_9NEOP|nr:unnamed protein product [Timema tahoe]